MIDQAQPFEGTLILEVVHGSQAFGLSGPDSDVDLKGVFVGPVSWYCGFLESPEQIILNKDHVRFEIRKFFRLATDGNPTALEMLWAPGSCHRTTASAGERLLSRRELFLSRRVAESFGSYAIAQLKRIKTHRRWLRDPPKTEPLREAFGLPNRSLISSDQMGAADVLIQRGDLTDGMLSPNFLEILDRERRYRVARREWQQFHAWKRDRNPARASLEEKFGYDTKHAQHLVRLLRMSIEILETGSVNVFRPDREELLAIKAGTWDFDTLIGYSESVRNRIEGARKTSRLPEEPDRAALNDLCRELVEETIHDNGD